MGGFMNIQLQNAMMNNNQSYGMYQNNLMHTGDPRDESDCNQLYQGLGINGEAVFPTAGGQQGEEHKRHIIPEDS